MTEAQFVIKLDAFLVNEFPTHTQAAKHYGISRTQLYKVLNMEAKPPELLLDDMGLRRDEKTIVSYRRA